MTALAPTLQAFFVERLLGQRGASPHTVAAYRDTFRLLLGFAAARTKKAPALLDLGDLDGPLVAAFLDHLERERGNGARTRNNRLAAIHSLFAYAAHRHPEHAASIARVLAIPTKRFERTLITYLTDAEVDALLAACDRATWAGRRDHALLTLAVGTGLRISELAGLRCADVSLGRGATVHCIGKGRKERRTPLVPVVANTLRVWLAERGGTASDPLFPARSGGSLSRDAIEHRIARCAARAAERCPSIRAKHVTAHVLRHTTAMRLLLAGVDVSVIALWLGHEQIATTGVYLQADLSLKERAIARVAPPGTTPGRYRAPDRLLAFLETPDYADLLRPLTPAAPHESPGSSGQGRHNREVGTIAVFAFALVVVVVGFLVITTYNAIVAAKNRVAKAWANIDVALKQRHDQLPNLVEAVRGIMRFEQGVLERVTELRAAYSEWDPIPRQAATSEATSAAVRQLFAVVERYPELRSAENVRALQDEISRLEDVIGDRRELYNDQVFRHNTRIAQVPANLVAGLFGWIPAPFFKASDEERARPAAGLDPA